MTAGDKKLRRWLILLKVYIAFSIVAGILFALALCYLALAHNPQGEFCAFVPEGQNGNFSSYGNECNIRVGLMTRIFLAFFAIGSGLLLTPVVICMSITAAVRWLLRRKAG